jgi:two-component system sensor kinase FixL
VQHYRQVTFLALIMLAISLLSVFIATVILYRSAIEQVRGRLADMVANEASLIDAVAEFDASHTHYERGPRAATLEQVDAAFKRMRFRPLGLTGAFTMAERVGDTVNILSYEYATPPETSVSWESLGDIPVRRALQGQFGTMIGPAWDGDEVIAAYAPVPTLGVGLVASIHMAELRAPFIRSALIAGAIALVLVSVGALLFARIGNPLIRRLQESEALFRRMFDDAPTAILILDPDTQLPVAYNDELLGILGYGRKEFATVPLGAYEAKERPEETAEHIRAIQAGQRLDFVTHWRTRRGDIRSIVVNVRMLTMDRRPVIHSVVTDITPLIEAEQRLQTLQQQMMSVARANEMGQMVSALAHELGQPLTAANNYINVIRRFAESEVCPTKEVMGATAAKAAQQIERASEIIQSLRRFLTQGELVRRSEESSHLVEEAINVALPEAMHRDLSIVRRLQPDLPPMAVERIQIQQVIVNLLRNAVEAMAGSPTQEIIVETALREQTQMIEIAVHDSGPGVPAEIDGKMFEPFITTKRDGLGLGLAIAHSIVRAHRGELWWERSAAGGATFRFTVPVAAP